MIRFPEPVVAVMAAIVLACASPASATGLACVLEGDFEWAGQRVVINECAENHRLPEPEFRRSCEAMGGAMDFHDYRRDAALLQSTQASCEAMGGTWSR